MNRWLEGLGGFSARWCWAVILAWVIILGGLLAANRQWGGTYVNNYNVPGTPSDHGLNRLNATFPAQGGYAGQIVFHAKTGTLTGDSAAINQATANVAALPHVLKAASPFGTPPGGAVSKDGTIAYSSVSWSANPSSLETNYLDRLNKAVAPARDAGLQIEYGAGAGQIGQKTNDSTSELIGLACALILLLFMFGSLVAAAIPLVSAIFSVGAGLSLLGVLAAAVTFPTTAPTIATLLGLGVAIDYGLFLVARHREQLDSGMDVVSSVRHAEGTSGASVVVAGSTVVISILGLYISEVSFVGALGLAAAITVSVSMLAALTLVPAFLGAARENIRALTARLHARKAHETAMAQAKRTAAATEQQHEQSAFARWGRKVSAHPIPWLVLSVVVLGVLAIPFFSITLGQPDNGTNPTSDSSRRAYDLMSQGFGVGSNGPLAIVVVLPKQSSSANSALLSNMQKAVASTPGVASVGPAAVNPSATTAVFSAIPTTRPQAAQTTNLVDRLRDDVLPKQPATTYVTGTTAGSVDFTRRITEKLSWLILAVIAIAFVLLTMAFRSVVIALKAAVLNLLSIGAAYGVIVAIFEWGWAKSVIGLQTTLPIPAYVPMLVFAIVFGLSMDYEVFLMSRIREAWVATGDERRAVAIGIGGTARVITTAAAIMVAVFLSFVANSDPTVKMLAIGMAFAVLIDASLVRMILVPAIMTLLGRDAWWMPRWMEPIVPHLQLEGSAAAAASAARSRQPSAATRPGAGGDAGEPGARTYSAVSSARTRPGDARSRDGGTRDAGTRDAGTRDAGTAHRDDDARGGGSGDTRG
ncbi:MAG TPA: MMPL family transporter [Streptosporangiaceae bacterium]